MTAKDVIRESLDWTKSFVHMYLADLSDEEILVRPVPAANHIAWQLGHCILGEVGMVKETVPTAAFPELSADFATIHDAKNSGSESLAGFLKKDEYLKLFDSCREATLAAFAPLADADLDRATTGSVASYAPTFGALFALVGTHTLMHAGQFAVVRRKLGKKIVF